MRNDYTEYLMHKDHKYLSKNWVKGKWQYIYDEKLGGKEKKAYEKAKMDNTHAKTLLKVRDSHVSDALKGPQSAYAKAMNNMRYAVDHKLESAKNDYDKTAIGKIDKMKSKGNDVINKLFSKQISKKSAKKDAAQKSAREEGMAERERQKTEDNKLRASETKQTDQFRKAKANIRDANADKRESGYGKEAVAKSEAERKQYLETRVKDIGKKRAEYENTLNDVVKSYANEYIKSLKGESNKFEESKSTLQNAALLLSHTKALESIFQQDLKDASMYGNYNSKSYGSYADKNKVNDYLNKLEKEYHKLMGFG